MPSVASSLRRVIRFEMIFTLLLTLLASALPLRAQHGHGGGGGGFHGGGGGFRTGGRFSSRPASSFRPSGPVNGARTLRPAGVGRAFSGRPLNPIPNRAAPAFRPGYGARRPAYPVRYPRRPAYNYGEGVVYSGAIASYGYGPGYGYGDLGFPYDDGYNSGGYDDQQQNPAYDQGNNYVAEAPALADEPQWPGSSDSSGSYAQGYSGAPQARMPAAPSAPVMPQEAVTLIFNNGTPNLQIHNYILSRDTLTVLDGRRREIPIASLDLAATEKANRAAGVDFALPDSR